MVAIKTEVTFCAHYGEDVFDPDLDLPIWNAPMPNTAAETV